MAIGGSAQLCLALLLISLGVVMTATQKSVVSLDPPWIRIFEGDKVTLSCNRNNSLQMNSTTTWIHNGIISNVTSSQWVIESATSHDSGKYICQKQGFYKSKPVYLDVMRDWLLLQTSSDMVLDNGSFDIKCRGWKNWNLRKVTYYKNNIAFQYKFESPTIAIRQATLNDSGTYHCIGYLKQVKHESEKFRIFVVKAYKSKYCWLQLIFPLLVVILFAVDTGLLLSTQEQFKSLLKIQKTGKGNKVET
ncbi:high affinity immunoglobulin epsilon receptor subunit alpha [Apodemus sylvaticus]|uniref:high affinity immunoglobulin epsilon receptor subunit alpha n=1 Tax=Apodemus sylvaticus TaxID=10129 RepID=UPI002242B487|nr:high affinity immunoglobulin epsilon receptor subunit alpha [Apodemus sylvaticus]XP_052056899.1 high affinity immunoglobulin epsilon receptor subunit alpha [Apodemus sylvaticus]